MIQSGRMGDPVRRTAQLTVPGLVQQLAKARARRLRTELEARGRGALRPGHVGVLVLLWAGGRRASDLAEVLGVSKQAVAQAVDQLVAEGSVERRADPDDARAKVICLTARGREALRVARQSSMAVEREWAERIGPAKLESLRSILTELVTGAQGS